MIKMFEKSSTYLVWTVAFAGLASIAVGFIDPVPCDEYYMGDSGIITHPNFPFNYSSGRRCLQRIYVQGFTSQNRKKICFTFHLFQLTNSSGCFDDYLEFPGDMRMVRYCGNGTAGQDLGDNRTIQNVFQPNFCWPLTSGAPFDLRFRSMARSSNLGYYAKYEILGVEENSLLPQASCSADQFTCFSRNCIPRNRLCNSVHDCLDWSDEGSWFARCPGLQSIDACSFESDMCQFTGEGVVRNTTSYYGPRFDNTFLTFALGHFVYFDGTGIAFLNYSATPVVRQEDHCLSFWYFMAGYVGSLTLYVTDGQGRRLAVWHRSDDHGAAWLQGEVDIPVEAFPLREITFEANEGQMDVNNIAIDDISLLKGNCYRDDVSCTFELGVCGWRHHTTSEMRWTRTYDPALTDQIGPDDFYKIHLDWQNCIEGARARLISRVVSYGFSGPSCLRFQFHRAVESNGILNVSIVNYLGLGQTVWSTLVSKPQTGKWVEVFVAFTISNGPFQVVFESKCVSPFSSDMSLDDIELRSGFCPKTYNPVRTEPPHMKSSTGHPSGCQWDEYKCEFTSQCINRRWMCNGRKDCEDGSDEKDCPITGGELLPNDGERVFLAHEVIIGVSVVCVAIFLTVVISIIIAVRRRSILRRMARIRAIRRQDHSVCDYPDPFPKPPPYDFSLPVAPSYVAHPPPYAQNLTGGDETDDGAPPPAYEMEPSFLDAMELQERNSLGAGEGPQCNDAFTASPDVLRSPNGFQGFKTSSV